MLQSRIQGPVSNGRNGIKRLGWDCKSTPEFILMVPCLISAQFTWSPSHLGHSMGFQCCQVCGPFKSESPCLTVCSGIYFNSSTWAHFVGILPVCSSALEHQKCAWLYARNAYCLKRQQVRFASVHVKAERPNHHVITVTWQGCQPSSRVGGGGGPPRQHVHDSIRLSGLRRARPKNPVLNIPDPCLTQDKAAVSNSKKKKKSRGPRIVWCRRHPERMFVWLRQISRKIQEQKKVWHIL